jgi:hemin uptake protein HemP
MGDYNHVVPLYPPIAGVSMCEIESSLGETPTRSDSNCNEPAKALSSEQLLQGRSEVFIEHEGQLYRLRVTSRGKLYLTK